MEQIYSFGALVVLLNYSLPASSICEFCSRAALSLATRPYGELARRPAERGQESPCRPSLNSLNQFYHEQQISGSRFQRHGSTKGPSREISMTVCLILVVFNMLMVRRMNPSRCFYNYREFLTNTKNVFYYLLIQYWKSKIS